MDTTTFITNAWVKSNGEIPTFVEGSDDWKYILALGNIWIDNWARSQDWNSLYDPQTILGTISAGNSVDIDTDEVRKFSGQNGDTVRIVHANGTDFSDYTLVPANELKNYEYQDACARVGETLQFTHDFTATDAQFGGTVYAPVYSFADHLSKAGDIVPVDDPNWLVAAVAAEIARNDILRKDQYQILRDERDELMAQMITANEGQMNLLTTMTSTIAGSDGGYSGNYNGYGEN